MARPKPVVLAILDGWGISVPSEGNAITQAKTPNMTSFWEKYAHTQLIAHGEMVGLPRNEAGNTETGHLNIGAGRTVYQDLPRINMSIADGSFFHNGMFLQAFEHVKKNNSSLHLMGLLGGAGVHADTSHLLALLRFCGEQQVEKVFLHMFTDGRDSPPNAGSGFVQEIEKELLQYKSSKIATIMGRFYAMDRDFRWDRTQKAYLCMTQGVGKTYTTAKEAIEKSYQNSLTDEFIEPSVIVDEKNQPVGLIKENDAVIFYNFRIDRPRQITKAFVLDDFEKEADKLDFDPFAVKYLKSHEASEKMISERMKPFQRGEKIKNLVFVTMTRYEKQIPCLVAYPPQEIKETLGEVLSKYGLNQLRMSESEKERFVTYYFNGQKEAPFDNEERIIIPSPKVPTYDKKPEMSAEPLTDKLISEINSDKYDVIIVNYANADMVGHTGNIKATIKGCEIIDECLGRLSDSVLKRDGVLLVTADHGNAEEMINRSSNMVDTEHNANPIPFIVVGNQYASSQQLIQGTLSDIAVTLLGILGITPPLSMTGRNLLK